MLNPVTRCEAPKRYSRRPQLRVRCTVPGLRSLYHLYCNSIFGCLASLALAALKPQKQRPLVSSSFPPCARRIPRPRDQQHLLTAGDMPTASRRAWPSRSALHAARSWLQRRQLWQHRDTSWARRPGCAPYSSRAHSPRASYEVPCGSAGTITVEISNGDLLATPSTPLIIYLPPTSAQLRHAGTPTDLGLSSSLNLNSNILGRLPVAQINYRWNVPGVSPDSPDGSALPSHPFPTPLHDTLHAYTWLTTSFLPSFSPAQTSDPSPRRSPSPYAPASQLAQRSSLRPLLIYGSFLGGTLASSLSLTETLSRPAGYSIKGAIIRNAIFDWTQVATSRPPTPSDPPPISSESDIWDINTFHAIKTKLFASPAGAFEPFASPLLFFRSPGFSTPSYFPGTAPPPSPSPTQDPALLDGLSISEEELASLRAAAAAAASSSPPASSASGQDDEVSVERKSALRFPPKDSGLRIPRSLLLTTSPGGVGTAPKKRARAKARQQEQAPGEEMRRQAQEMAKVMRRSLVMYEFKDRAAWDDGDPHALSEERVQVRDVGAQADDAGVGELEVIDEWVDGLGLEV